MASNLIKHHHRRQLRSRRAATGQHGAGGLLGPMVLAPARPDCAHLGTKSPVLAKARLTVAKMNVDDNGAMPAEVRYPWHSPR